jgi:hypothetical protein
MEDMCGIEISKFSITKNKRTVKSLKTQLVVNKTTEKIACTNFTVENCS